MTLEHHGDSISSTHWHIPFWVRGGIISITLSLDLSSREIYSGEVVLETLPLHEDTRRHKPCLNPASRDCPEVN